MKIDIKSLQKKMDIAKIGANESIYINNHMIFGFNRDFCIFTDIDIDGDFSVPVEFVSTLKKLKEDEIDIFVDENVSIKTKHSAFEFPLETHPYDHFFKKMSSKKEDWIIFDADDFHEKINVCSETLDNSWVDLLSTVLVKNDIMIASKAIAVTRCKLPSDFGEFFVSEKIINIVKKYAPRRYCVDDEFTFFDCVDFTIGVKNPVGNIDIFDYDKDFEIEGAEIVFPENTIEAIGIVETYGTKGQDKLREIRIRTNGDCIEIIGESGKGKAVQKIDYDCDVEFDFVVGSDLFSKSLKLFDNKACLTENDSLLFKKRNVERLILVINNDD